MQHAIITDDHYQMFVDEPLRREIWTATQANRALIEAAERQAILVEPHEARRMLALFKKPLPTDLSTPDRAFIVIAPLN